MPARQQERAVWETLEAFMPTRIGHGVRCIEDARLVEHLIENRIHLEVCPSINVQTRACTSRDHPVDILFRQGVSLGISTDIRTITNVNLNAEYVRLHEQFTWGVAEFLACNRAALDAAFIGQPLRQRLMRSLSLL